MSVKCLYCYEEIDNSLSEYHIKCSRRMFGVANPPLVEMSLADIEEYAKLALSKSLAVAGVQPKLSLELKKKRNIPSRLTIVGMFGNYILKPPFARYPEMPELEDVTMGMAERSGIKTATHSLIRLASGELAYLSKRFDREKKQKIHVEDFAQLHGVLTERKYKGSVEKIGKTIERFSSFPGNDIIRLFEIVLFSFLTGNSDMHLKNYSLVRDHNDDIQLSPAYDLVPVKLILPEDQEDSALTICGKKAKLTKNDFDSLADYFKINSKALTGIYERLYSSQKEWKLLIEKSLISEKLKESYNKLIDKNFLKIYN